MSEGNDRRSMISRRKGTAYKYTRVEGSKICNNYFLQVQKGSSSPCTNGQSSSISLFGEKQRGKKPTHGSGGKENMGILFSQSDHAYCRIPARNFKYHGRQNFVKQMDIKEANISKTYTGVRTSVCGSACIQVVQPDSKVHKLATRSTCRDMVDAFQINWSHLKAYAFPPFALIGRVLAKAMRGKHIDHSVLIIVTPMWPSQPWYTHLLRMSIQDSVFIPLIPNLLTDPNQNQPPLCQNQTASAVWKVSGNSIVQKT